VKEYRDYFLAKEHKKDRNKKIYQNQSSVRCADELDPIFRGGMVSDEFLYKVNPDAGASMHSKNTWKSVLSHSDDLASSDPIMAKKQAKLQALFRNQSKWIKMQQVGMAQKNDRFEHLVQILRDEIKNEHEREGRALKASKHAVKNTQMQIYRERLDTVDKIMGCLQSYNFTSGLDEADFLLFCFIKWKETLHHKVYGKNLFLTQNAVRKAGRSGSAPGGQEHGREHGRSHQEVPQSLKSGSAAETRPGGEAGAGGGAGREEALLLPPPSREGSKQQQRQQPSGPSNYNRMISASSPYEGDAPFLEHMKRKADRLRALAIRGPLSPDNSSVVSDSVAGSTTRGGGKGGAKGAKGKGDRSKDKEPNVPLHFLTGDTGDMDDDDGDNSSIDSSNLAPVYNKSSKSANFSMNMDGSGSIIVRNGIAEDKIETFSNDGASSLSLSRRNSAAVLDRADSYVSYQSAESGKTSAFPVLERNDSIVSILSMDNDSNSFSAEHIQDKLLQHALQPGVSSSAAAASAAAAAAAAAEAALSVKEKDALHRKRVLEHSMRQAQRHSEALVADAAREEEKRKIVHNSVPQHNYHITPFIHPREIDDINNAQAKRAFKYVSGIVLCRVYCNFCVYYPIICSRCPLINTCVYTGARTSGTTSAGAWTTTWRTWRPR
jgi:hypothetical protein